MNPMKPISVSPLATLANGHAILMTDEPGMIACGTIRDGSPAYRDFAAGAFLLVDAGGQPLTNPIDPVAVLGLATRCAMAAAPVQTDQQATVILATALLGLAECLRLQLIDLDHLDPAMAALVDNLPLVARRDFNALKVKCGVTMEDLQDMLAELRALNPKPGLAFGTEPTLPVVPDVFVRPSPDGNWIVELNSETLPRVLVNNRYMATVARGAKSEDDRLFLAGCHAQAAWLVKSLEQRAKTVLKVAREIVRQQDAFLVLGVQHLRPLNLRNVAEAIEMHESTVSRVTSNKYMATPRGIFELKYFFTTAIASSDGDGDAHSAEAVRHRIKDLVAQEGDDVLSDDTIVEKLKAQGVDIARRTVAKYREGLGIPSSVQRRRERKVKPAQSR